MKVVRYILENNQKLYDFDTMKQLLGTSKSKLQREIKKIVTSENDLVKYKNLHLYKETVFFNLVENYVFDKLIKEFNTDGSQKD